MWSNGLRTNVWTWWNLYAYEFMEFEVKRIKKIIKNNDILIASDETIFLWQNWYVNFFKKEHKIRYCDSDFSIKKFFFLKFKSDLSKKKS